MSRPYGRPRPGPAPPQDLQCEPGQGLLLCVYPSASRRSGQGRLVVTQALVLNASFEPLCVVSQRRAVVLLLTDKAVVVEPGQGALHSATRVVQVPAVVRLTRFVKVPYRATVPLTRKAVFARDVGRCVYCNATATSLDHVVPRSRGGEHVSENVVSCCSRCN